MATPQDTAPDVEQVSQPEVNKETRDLEERKKNEKKIRSLITKLHDTQDKMYAIRFDSERDVKSMETEMKSLATEVMKIEIKIARTINRSLDVFETQLNLSDINCDELFADGLRRKKVKPRDRSTFRRAHVPKKSAAEELHEGGFMRTASTKVIEDKSATSLWQSLSKMWNEWKFQTTVAEAQYVASRDPDLSELESEIAKLRAAIREMNQRKQLNKRDQRVLHDLQDQLKLRLQQKDRYIRATFGKPEIVEQPKQQEPTKSSKKEEEVISLEESKQ